MLLFIQYYFYVYCLLRHGKSDAVPFTVVFDSIYYYSSAILAVTVVCLKNESRHNLRKLLSLLWMTTKVDMLIYFFFLSPSFSIVLAF